MLHTSGTFYLHTGDTLDFSTSIAGYKPHEQPQPIDAAQETLRPSELVEHGHGGVPGDHHGASIGGGRPWKHPTLS